MTREMATGPKFHKNQLVELSLYDVEGEVKNEFARRAMPYYDQAGVLVKCQRYIVADIPMLVYSVKSDDGIILKLPEDCLFEVRGNRV